MTQILHTGDTHLGYQQYHSPARREDFLDAFRQVLRDAVEADVDAVVHAGDLFDDRQPALTDVMGALSVLRTLADAGIPFYGVVGNHESKRDSQWLDLFERMGVATRLGRDPVVVGNTALYGLDFVPRSRRAGLEYEFAPPPSRVEHTALVSHGLFEPFDHGDWDARRLLSESPVGFDAMLLGDDHTPRTRHLDEFDTWLTYCGSTERASASERDPRGYNLVRFDDGVDIRRRGLETREFVFVDVELAEGEGTGRVLERLRGYDIDGAVVVVTVTGEGERVTPAEIETEATERGALVARVTDRRDHGEESEVEVSFANPDRAVEQRVRDLGLSPAARELDETVRAGEVADSNVADTVERRVRDLVADEDPDLFVAGDESADPDGDETAPADVDGDETVDKDEDAPEDDEGAPADSDGEVAPADGEPDPDSSTGDGDDDTQVQIGEYS